MVVPAVIHKVNAVVDRSSNDANAFSFVLGNGHVITAQSDKRNFFSRAPQSPVRHLAHSGPRNGAQRFSRCWSARNSARNSDRACNSGCHFSQKTPSVCFVAAHVKSSPTNG